VQHLINVFIREIQQKKMSSKACFCTKASQSTKNRHNLSCAFLSNTESGNSSINVLSSSVALLDNSATSNFHMTSPYIYLWYTIVHNVCILLTYLGKQSGKSRRKHNIVVPFVSQTTTCHHFLLSIPHSSQNNLETLFRVYLLIENPTTILNPTFHVFYRLSLLFFY
jgi:hypothetical protein